MVDLTHYRFANGSKDKDYPGVIMANGTEILETIAQTLSDSSWIINDQISNSHYLIGQGTTANGHNCWYKFFDDEVGNIKVYGDLDGGNTTLSPVYTLPYPTDGTPMHLYVSSREDAGSISIVQYSLQPNPVANGSFFGFVNREDPTDQFAAYVGPLTVEAAYQAAMMKHLATGQNWRVIGADFATPTLYSNQYTSVPLQALDYLMMGKPYQFFTGNSSSNPWFAFYNGMPNGLTGKFSMLPLYLLEGYGNASGYGLGNSIVKENKNCAKPLPRRGYHPFAIAGMSNALVFDLLPSTSDSGVTRVGKGLGVGKIGMLVDVYQEV